MGRKVQDQPYHPACNFASPFQPWTPKESSKEWNPAASCEEQCIDLYDLYCRLTALGV